MKEKDKGRSARVCIRDNDMFGLTRQFKVHYHNKEMRSISTFASLKLSMAIRVGDWRVGLMNVANVDVAKFAQ